MDTEKTSKMPSIKEFVFSGAIFVAAACIGWTWKFVGSFGGVATTTGVAMIGVFFWACAVVIFIVLLSLFALASRSLLLTIAISFISSVLFFIFYRFDDVYLWGIAASSLLFIWGIHATRREASACVRYRWNTLCSHGIKKFFTAIAFSLAILYFSLSTHGENLRDVLIPRAVFDGVSTALETPLSALFPGFALKASVDEAIIATIARHGSGVIDVGQVPKGVLQQLVVAERMALNKQFNLKLTGKEKITDVIYSAASRIIDTYTMPYAEYLPVAMTIGYFAMLQFILFLLSFLIYAFFPLFAWILLFIGILRKESIMVDKEVLEF